MGIAYREYGDRQAPLIVMLHGGGVSDWMWDRQVQAFADYHCVVPILPEHGMNPGDTPFSIRGSAEQVIRLIEAKGSEKQVTIIGFSLGAQVAIQLLSMKPDIADYAVVNSALVRPMRWAKPFIGPTVRASFPLIRNRRFARLQARSLYVGEDNFERYYEESARMKPESLIRILEENMSFRLPAAFSHATGRILVTAGAQEKAVMIRSVHDIAAANSNCTGIILPGIGHGMPLGMPDAFNAMVRKWLSTGRVPEGCTVVQGK